MAGNQQNNNKQPLDVRVAHKTNMNVTKASYLDYRELIVSLHSARLSCGDCEIFGGFYIQGQNEPTPQRAEQMESLNE